MSHRMVSFTARERIHESLLARFTRACSAGRGSGLSQSRECAIVWHLAGYPQAVLAPQRREEGHVRPKAIPGRPPKKRAQVEAGVLPQLQAHSDATLEQHCDLWEQTHSERVRSFPMSRAIKRLGWTRKKKSLGATERNEEERARLSSKREHASDRSAGSY
jgi:hypothetical protein